MIQTKKIINFCADYLKVKDFSDGCVNGLQVEGANEVDKIIVGVSISEKLIKEAIRRKVQMIIVHHGFFANSIPNPPVLKNYLRTRLKLLLENNINLAGFHLPLDAHPVIGNNIALCKLFGLKNMKPYDVGFVGELSKEMKFAEFVKIVDKKLGVKSYAISSKNGRVKKVGVISGGADGDFEITKELGADTFVTGSIAEWNVRSIEEVDLNFINAGHYNTEKLGVINLGKLIEKKFGVKCEFVEVANEI